MLLITALALAAAPPPIVNGEETDDYPEVVLLRHTTADGNVAFVCTGTLISPDVALTAAHCLSEVDGYELTDVRVYSGAVWTQTAPERQAERWMMHPDYSVSDDGLEIVADLGLVFLGEPYAMEGKVINADAFTEADVGSSHRYVGWGASDDDASDSGYFKRAADIPLQGLEGEFLLGYDGEKGSATCGGDSGGPVFELVDGAIGSLVGVHSFGRDDDGTVCAGSVSGDTRVDLYVDWIVAEGGAMTDAEVVADEVTDGDGRGEGEDEEEVAGCSSGPPAVNGTEMFAPLAWICRRRSTRPAARTTPPPARWRAPAGR